jgi:hypothetical protein
MAGGAAVDRRVVAAPARHPGSALCCATPSRNRCCHSPCRPWPIAGLAPKAIEPHPILTITLQQSSNPSGPVVTLGSVVAAKPTLIVWCRACQHKVEPDPGEIAARYGVEMRVPNAVALLDRSHSTYRRRVVLSLCEVAAQLQLHARQLTDAGCVFGKPDFTMKRLSVAPPNRDLGQ